MIDTLLDIFKANQIGQYLIQETFLETAELFFVKQSLDMRRAENVHTISVTLYRDFEKEGKCYRGDASFLANPSDSRAELEEKCRRAYLSASFVPNEHYELISGQKEECMQQQTDLADMSLEAAAGALAKAIYDAEKDFSEKSDASEAQSFMNSAEIFVERKKSHVINASGVDVSCVTYNVNGEFVVQCKAPQDVEMWQNFSYDTLNLTALREKVSRALSVVHDRAHADTAPKAGNYDVILSDQYVRVVMGYYLDRASGAYIYNNYSDFAPGNFVQGDKEKVSGELLNLTYMPTVPYSSEGVAMKELPCIRDGIFENIHSGVRFAYYLNAAPTGSYTKIKCAPGHMSFEEMKQKKGLYVVNFSDFQMDAMTGYYGGEIRLAYLNDGEKIVPVTGGSINGSIYEAQKDFVFSSELQKTDEFEGPKAMLIKNVSVAGA